MCPPELLTGREGFEPEDDVFLNMMKMTTGRQLMKRYDWMTEQEVAIATVRYTDRYSCGSNAASV